MTRPLTVGIISREYPPEVYGGAGVHVAALARFLERHVKAEVYCFGKPRSAPEVAGSFEPAPGLDGNAPHLAALRTLSVNLAMAARLDQVDLVHSHTWYANFAGHLAKTLYGIPHVVTSHSLEPLRPWKREQLGGGYDLSCYCEKTAVENADAIVAVSSGMKQDILACYPAVDPDRVHVIYNGIDPQELYPEPEKHELVNLGIDPTIPYVVFVGRVTRQKGIVHLLAAARQFLPGTQLVLCAGEADTPELGREVESLVAELKATRGHVVWIPGMLGRSQLRQVLTHARAFVCPSVYEPFGIVNIEAMVCGVPVVASAVGGIPEIVEDGRTGLLVPLESASDAAGIQRFESAFAGAVNRVFADAELARSFGDAGRQRALDYFTWPAIAEKTAALYASLRRGSAA
jgi:starch synthase